MVHMSIQVFFGGASASSACGDVQALNLGKATGIAPWATILLLVSDEALLDTLFTRLLEDVR
jgi:hypothetical protein